MQLPKSLPHIAILFVILSACAVDPQQGIVADPTKAYLLDLATPVPVVLEHAEGGTIEAIHSACFRFMYGTGGATVDRQTAFHWCTIGSERGIPSSITLLAELYYRGDGAPRSLERARELYVQAANLHHRHAALVAGVMYWRGEGGAIDLDSARHYLSLSAKLGNEQAVRLLPQLTWSAPPPEAVMNEPYSASDAAP